MSEDAAESEQQRIANYVAQHISSATSRPYKSYSEFENILLDDLNYLLVQLSAAHFAAVERKESPDA